MIVRRHSLLAGAADARGIVVVIDVLRAFSCSALMFHYGIRDMALVKTPQGWRFKTRVLHGDAAPRPSQ